MNLQLNILNGIRKDVLYTELAYIARVTEPLDYKGASKLVSGIGNNALPDFVLDRPETTLVDGTITTDDYILVDTSLSYITRIWLVKDFDYIIIPLSNSDFKQAKQYIKSIENSDNLQNIDRVLSLSVIPLEKYRRIGDELKRCLGLDEDTPIAQRFDTIYLDRQDIWSLQLSLYTPVEDIDYDRTSRKLSDKIYEYFEYVLGVLRESNIYQSDFNLVAKIFYKIRTNKFIDNPRAIYGLSNIPAEEAEKEFLRSVTFNLSNRITF